jgi:hypothetical protein
MQYENRTEWIEELDKLFAALEMEGPALNDTCATQVHISVDSGWNAPVLRAIAVAIMVFMPEFRTLADKLRTGIDYPVPNPGHSENYEGKMAIGKILKHLQDCEDESSLIQAMQGPKPGVHENPTRCYWNFNRLANPDVLERYRTIEFRMAPRSESAKQAKFWIDFVALFVTAALEKNSQWENVESPGSLYDVIIGQASKLKIVEDVQEALEKLLF